MSEKTCFGSGKQQMQNGLCRVLTEQKDVKSGQEPRDSYRISSGSSSTSLRGVPVTSNNSLVLFLLLHGHGHGDRFKGIVAVVPDRGDDLIDHIHAPKDFAEDCIGAV